MLPLECLFWIWKPKGGNCCPYAKLLLQIIGLFNLGA